MSSSNLALLIEHFLLRDLRSLRLEVEAYADESLIWAQPPGLPNSAGTLTLHLAGNLRHYVGSVLGGGSYVRDRDLEFSARGLPRQQLLAEIAEAEAAIEATLPRLTEARLAEPYPEPIRGYYIGTSDLLLHLAVHLGYHLGQVSYHRRLVTGDAQGVGALSPAELFTARPLGEPPAA